ncbi:hypothetical protein PtA15_1A35 [Puccinia triticina]|uniref:Uncharacterized protein n=1 Tax=Puccinia triticina TaxID=208348 RepID=A0ABY7CCZ5_9BASI|nr:uncharacterized protein PtA15_1A35 [Puccinia triticina]WAQ80697.1 hypothetical protein PtA15_1A35 [Puccinia triticina]
MATNHAQLPDPRGFIAGLLSGLTKLAVGHPFDTIKLRIQCAPAGVFHGPLDCFLQTIRNEGPRALYKGASPPAAGWAVSDAVLMGSLERYRRWLGHLESPDGAQPLSLRSHAVAGALAGWTVCSIVTPIETIKAKLQIQTSDPRTRLYTGPIDCASQIVRAGGLQSLYRALPATLIFRTCFALMFSSYHALNHLFQTFATHHPSSLFALGPSVSKFIAGGLAAEVFWLVGYPLDTVKNRIMCDSLTNRRYPTWLSAARAIRLEGGIKAFYRGMTPCLLRAFPTNAAALAVWEGAMRGMRP